MRRQGKEKVPVPPGQKSEVAMTPHKVVRNNSNEFFGRWNAIGRIAGKFRKTAHILRRAVRFQYSPDSILYSRWRCTEVFCNIQVKVFHNREEVGTIGHYQIDCVDKVRIALVRRGKSQPVQEITDLVLTH